MTIFDISEQLFCWAVWIASNWSGAMAEEAFWEVQDTVGALVGSNSGVGAGEDSDIYELSDEDSDPLEYLDDYAQKTPDIFSTGKEKKVSALGFRIKDFIAHFGREPTPDEVTRLLEGTFFLSAEEEASAMVHQKEAEAESYAENEARSLESELAKAQARVQQNEDRLVENKVSLQLALSDLAIAQEEAENLSETTSEVADQTLITVGEEGVEGMQPKHAAAQVRYNELEDTIRALKKIEEDIQTDLDEDCAELRAITEAVDNNVFLKTKREEHKQNQIEAMQKASKRRESRILDQREDYTQHLENKTQPATKLIALQDELAASNNANTLAENKVTKLNEELSHTKNLKDIEQEHSNREQEHGADKRLLDQEIKRVHAVEEQLRAEQEQGEKNAANIKKLEDKLCQAELQAVGTNHDHRDTDSVLAAVQQNVHEQAVEKLHIKQLEEQVVSIIKQQQVVTEQTAERKLKDSWNSTKFKRKLAKKEREYAKKVEHQEKERLKWEAKTKKLQEKAEAAIKNCQEKVQSLELERQALAMKEEALALAESKAARDAEERIKLEISSAKTAVMLEANIKTEAAIKHCQEKVQSLELERQALAMKEEALALAERKAARDAEERIKREISSAKTAAMLEANIKVGLMKQELKHAKELGRQASATKEEALGRANRKAAKDAEERVKREISSKDEAIIEANIKIELLEREVKHAKERAERNAEMMHEEMSRKRMEETMEYVRQEAALKEKLEKQRSEFQKYENDTQAAAEKLKRFENQQREALRQESELTIELAEARRKHNEEMEILQREFDKTSSVRKNLEIDRKNLEVERKNISIERSNLESLEAAEQFRTKLLEQVKHLDDSASVEDDVQVKPLRRASSNNFKKMQLSRTKLFKPMPVVKSLAQQHEESLQALKKARDAIEYSRRKIVSERFTLSQQDNWEQIVKEEEERNTSRTQSAPNFDRPAIPSHLLLPEGASTSVVRRGKHGRSRKEPWVDPSPLRRKYRDPQNIPRRPSTTSMRLRNASPIKIGGRARKVRRVPAVKCRIKSPVVQHSLEIVFPHHPKLEEKRALLMQVLCDLGPDSKRAADATENLCQMYNNVVMEYMATKLAGITPRQGNSTSEKLKPQNTLDVEETESIKPKPELGSPMNDDTALDMLNRALNLTEPRAYFRYHRDLRVSLRSITLNNLACFYSSCDSPRMALKSLWQARVLWFDEKKKKNQSANMMASIEEVRTILNMSSLYNKMGDAEKALKMLSNACTSMRKNIPPSANDLFPLALYSLGCTHEHLLQWQKAARTFREGFVRAEQMFGDDHPLVRQLKTAITDTQCKRDELQASREARRKKMKKSLSYKQKPVLAASAITLENNGGYVVV